MLALVMIMMMPFAAFGQSHCQRVWRDDIENGNAAHAVFGPFLVGQEEYAKEICNIQRIYDVVSEVYFGVKPQESACSLGSD